MSNNLVFKLKSVTVADSPLTLQKLTTEAANEIEHLQKQVAMAHGILSSEPFAWLVTGSNHEYLHWQELKPFIQNYWDEYGSYFKKAVRGD